MFTPDKIVGGLSALDTLKYRPVDAMAHIGINMSGVGQFYFCGTSFIV